MKLVGDEDSKKKPLPLPDGKYACPKCRAVLIRVAYSSFGYDVICPKGHYRGGVAKD